MKALRNIIQSFSQTNVLVIGDLIFDVYHEGTPLGISAETPTIVLKHKNSVTTLGGAGCLVRHMLELGGKVIFLTVVGSNSFSRHITQFAHKNLKKIFLRETGRTSTIKERFWGGGYKLLSWDRLDNRPISSVMEKKIESIVAKNIHACDRIIVSDYRHGLLTERLARALVQLAHTYKKPLYLDSQISQNKGNHVWYRGADCVCFNQREAASIDPEWNPRMHEESLRRTQKIMDARAVVVKLGENGSAAVVGNAFIETPAIRVDAKDTTGAGDAFFAALALAKRIGKEELAIANAWAGLSTTIVGTVPPKKIDLQKYAHIRF